MKPKPPGNFNCCVVASLYGKDSEHLGYCLYTPRAVAHAIFDNPQIHTVRAKYPGWAEEIKSATDFQSHVDDIKEFGRELTERDYRP